MNGRDGLLPGEHRIPQGYDGVGAVQKLLKLPVGAPPTSQEVVEEVDRWLNPRAIPRPYTRKLPPNGSIFTHDGFGHALFPVDGDDILGEEIATSKPSRRVSACERKPGLIDRLIERVFILLDSLSMRI